MSVSESAIATLQCGACEHSNIGTAQFCASCGHALYEPCKICSEPVSLTQKFCVGCGSDLVAWLKERSKDNECKLGEAVAAAKQHEYERALAILARLGEVRDFRFADHSATAQAARSKIERLRDRTLAEAAARIEQAKQASQDGDQSKVVALLSTIADRLLDDESRQLLRAGRLYTDQLQSLQSELQQYLIEKNYIVSAGLVGQLLELRPDNEKYQTLAKQLGDKLLRRCEKLYAQQDYNAASETLLTLPESVRGAAYVELQQKIETARWLADQFQGEPYATASLGRLAIRFAKEIPASGQASQLVADLKERVKAKRNSLRDASADWTGGQISWIGGRVGVFGQVQSMDTSKLEEPIPTLAPYAVAIGLALQGVGRSRVAGNMVTSKKTLIGKDGLLAKIAKGKSGLAWGIDVGSSGIRAALIQIEKGSDEPVLVKCVNVDYPAPICRGGGVRGAEATVIPDAIGILVEQIDLKGAAVWCNLPSYEAVSRFCELPPVNDKEAQKLIDAEVRSRIPIDCEDLTLLTWMHGFDREAKTGRPLLMAAATKVTIQRRIDLLGSGGLESIDGMVPDAVALVNFAAYEFMDFLFPPPPEDANGDQEASGKKRKEAKPNDRPMIVNETQRAVALVDVGAAKTTLVVVSPIAVWYWTQETGGEEMTSIVARETKVTSEKAEQTKRNLAALEFPDQVDMQIEQRQAALKMRLVKLLKEAKATFNDLDIQQTWCVGRAHLQHGFVRRVLKK